MNLGVVIQARVGSTRLPLKMVKPFFDGRTIPEILLERLRTVFTPGQIVLATTVADEDSALVRFGNDAGVHVLRGSIRDVLSRFVHAAEVFDFTHVIRICADNPFMRLDGIQELIRHAESHPLADYITYAYADGLPVMRGHVGMYAELIRRSALQDLHKSTSSDFYREHVTNGIYSQPEKYNLVYVPLPEQLLHDTTLRLTVDTAEDFNLLSELACNLGLCSSSRTYSDPSIQAILDAVNSHPEARRTMQEIVQKNTK